VEYGENKELKKLSVDSTTFLATMGRSYNKPLLTSTRKQKITQGKILKIKHVCFGNLS
jgi:hypothetical protein